MARDTEGLLGKAKEMETDVKTEKPSKKEQTGMCISKIRPLSPGPFSSSQPVAFNIVWITLYMYAYMVHFSQITEFSETGEFTARMRLSGRV